MALTYRRNYTIFNIKKNEIVLNQKLSPFRAITEADPSTDTLTISRIKDIESLIKLEIIHNDFKSLNKKIEIFKLDKYDDLYNIFLDENLSLIYDFDKNKKSIRTRISAYKSSDNKPSKLSMKQHKLQKSLSNCIP